MHYRTGITWIALFLFGAAALYIGAYLSRGLWFLIGALVAEAIVAGLIEVVLVRRTGRRRWIGAWLPCILGMAALTAGTIASEQQGPDSGLALSIVVFIFVIITPLFALLVHSVAAIVLRCIPPAASNRS